MVGLLAAGGAFAFFTSGGAGAGTASTADTAGLAINQTSVVAGLTPGGAPVVLSGTYDNPNTSAIHVDGLWATVGTNDKVGCDPSNYVIGGSVAASDVGAGPGLGQGSWSGLTVKMLDTRVDQDVCKGATLNINYTTTAPVVSNPTFAIAGGVLTISNYNVIAHTGAAVEVAIGPSPAGGTRTVVGASWYTVMIDGYLGANQGIGTPMVAVPSIDVSGLGLTVNSTVIVYVTNYNGGAPYIAYPVTVK